MLRFRARQRITAWIACFAILIGALAPAVSQAMAPAAQWMEICTIAGTERIAVDAGLGERQGEPAALMAEHCPYCFTHAGSFGLPPADVPVFAVAGAADSLPLLYYAAPRPLFAWATAQPRAPPQSA